MKKLFWIPASFVLLFLGFVGFFLVAILAAIGMGLDLIAEGLGFVFDWYQIKLLHLLRYTGDKTFND
jgi:hypothetical protein